MSSLSVPFSLFRLQTSANLFLPQLLRYHLATNHLSHALRFASNYRHLVYFAHSLEILLHSVLEDTVDLAKESNPKDGGELSLAIEFLDHFPQALDVVVACARKTELERWTALFDVVGKPRDLFERCLSLGRLRTAASYLLILQSLEELDDTQVSRAASAFTQRLELMSPQDTMRLLKLALAAKEYHLCKEVLRFLHSIDETGEALKRAIKEVGVLPDDAPPAANITP